MGRKRVYKVSSYIKESWQMKLYIDPFDAKKYITTAYNKIIAKGGDGTLLKAIKMFHHFNLPFYPYASGTKNFMMNDCFKLYDLTTVPLNLIQVQKDPKAVAFNEIAIGSFCGWIEFSTPDAKFPKFKGSGIIIATAQGSTGLNLNNGGPILPLDSNQWVVTSNQATSTVKTVVNATRLTIKAISREPFQIKLDGVLYKETTEIELTIQQGPVVNIQYADILAFKEKRWNNR